MTRMRCRKPTSQTVLTVLLLLLIAATVAFTWGNSLESRTESAQKSQKVLEVVSVVLEPILGEGKVTIPLVRKLAHVTEFGVLGIGLALLLVVRRQVKGHTVVFILLASLFVAVVDETLQIFSRRGPLVSDIWIDMAGATVGIILVLCVRWISLLIRRKRIGEESIS